MVVRRSAGALGYEFLKFSLFALAAFDIGAGAEPFKDAACVIADGSAADLEPAVVPCGIPQAVFQVDRDFILDGGFPAGAHVSAIVGMDRFDPFVPQLFLGGNASVATPLRADVIAIAIDRAGPDQLRDSFGEHSELGFAAVQGFAGVLLFADIT